MKKFVILSFIVCVVLGNFSIYADYYEESDAYYLHDLGLFNGKSTTEFVPALKDSTTAAEAITLIGRALKWDVDMEAVSSFLDVPDWAVPYTEYARDNGITTGVGNGLFGVDQIDGKRMFTWFLAALGEDKARVWANTENYAEQYGIAVPNSALRSDVVYIISEGIQHPRLGKSEKISDQICNAFYESGESILPGLPMKFTEYHGGSSGKDLTFFKDGSFRANYWNTRSRLNCTVSGKFELVEKVDEETYVLMLSNYVIDSGNTIFDFFGEIGSGDKIFYLTPGAKCPENFSIFGTDLAYVGNKPIEKLEKLPVYGLYYDVNGLSMIELD